MLLLPMKLDGNKALIKIFGHHKNEHKLHRNLNVETWINFVEFMEIVENKNFQFLRFRT